MRIGAIIQARMSSSRLAGKVLVPVDGRPLLQYLLERVGRSSGIDEIVVATSVASGDDPIVSFCREWGVRFSRGPLDNVAERFASTARVCGLDGFVRLCGDSPLIDPGLVSRAVCELRARKVDLVTNVFPRTYPHGQSVEVIDARVFAQALPSMCEPAHQEHVTSFLYEHAERFRIWNMPGPPANLDVSFAIDTRADLDRFESLVGLLDRPHWEYGLEELVGLQRQLGEMADEQGCSESRRPLQCGPRP